MEWFCAIPTAPTTRARCSTRTQQARSCGQRSLFRCYARSLKVFGTCCRSVQRTTPPRNSLPRPWVTPAPLSSHESFFTHCPTYAPPQDKLSALEAASTQLRAFEEKDASVSNERHEIKIQVGFDVNTDPSAMPRHHCMHLLKHPPTPASQHNTTLTTLSLNPA